MQRPATVHAASAAMNWSRDVQELTAEVYRALEEVAAHNASLTSPTPSLQERLQRLAESPPHLPERAIPSLIVKATAGERSVEALLSVYPEFQDATALVVAEERRRTAVVKLQRLLRELLARSVQDMLASVPDEDGSSSSHSSHQLSSASAAAMASSDSMPHLIGPPSPATSPNSMTTAATSAIAHPMTSSPARPPTSLSSSSSSAPSASLMAALSPSTAMTPASGSRGPSAFVPAPPSASSSPSSSPSGSLRSVEGAAAPTASPSVAHPPSSRPGRPSSLGSAASISQHAGDGRGGAGSTSPPHHRADGEHSVGRSSAGSAASKIHLPSWCAGPLQEDPLQIVPEGGLGLTPPQVWQGMCQLSKPHLAMRVWTERGPDSLLAAIIRSEDFDAVSKHQHPTEEDIILLRNNLQTLLESCGDDEFDSWFPGAMIHPSRDELIAVLDEPRQYLEGELLYVYHAWASGPDSSIRIHLITVGDGAPHLSIIGNDDGSSATADCTTIYEMRSVSPAHYEAVCFRKPQGNSRHRTLWPSADPTMRALQAWQPSSGVGKKRKAADSLLIPSSQQLLQRLDRDMEAPGEFGEDTEEDEGGIGQKRRRENGNAASM